ncbi:hypothetical protein BDW02DRAFT_651986 [Decorospora gaudefroyi]|uniref:Uncharacterized protein n=1 Tax=Decorospora gaudefroyi TaxID=184978 RepID=A0A6A5K275_9PLEO|nr:hypothetical protein BDW02DRAFT_651986 [Decorospora gaudefroyi]
MGTASDVRDWIGVSAAIAGVVGLLWAVFTYLAGARANQRKEDPGAVFCNKERMGFFAAKTPPVYNPIKPWRPVKAPRIPSITAMLRAGEAGIWTSAMVEGMTMLEDAATWKPICEEFLRTLLYSDSSKIPHKMRRSLKKARLGQIQKEGFGGFRFWKHERISDEAEARHAQRMDVYKRKILWCCAKPLDYLDNTKPEDESPLQGPNSIWNSNMQRLRLRDGKITMNVSKSELAGFCLSFGIIPRWEFGGKNAFHGSGAFEISLEGRYDGQDFLLSMKKSIPSGWHEPRDSAMGSGYSVLFAKFMVCGLLPFAQVKGYINAIEVNRDMLDAIRTGNDVADSPVLPVLPASAKILRSLQNHKHINIFDVSRAKPGPLEGHCGTILNDTFELLDPKSPERWTWPAAVAGIAFGGLVPVVTRALVEAVRFTALGVDSVGDPKADTFLLEQLERTIDWVHKTARDSFLFGKETVPNRTSVAEGVLHYTTLPDNFTVATVASMFSRYTTMLERLVALAAANSHQQYPVEYVFKELCKHLTQVHDKAVWQRNPAKRPVDWEEPKSSHLGTVCQGLMKDEWRDTVGNVTLDHCVTVARLIIVSWTHLANLVSWEGDLEPEGKFESRSPPPVKFMSIDEIKYDFALC